MPRLNKPSLTLSISILASLIFTPAYSAEDQGLTDLSSSESLVSQTPSQLLSSYLAPYTNVKAEFKQTTYTRDSNRLQQIQGRLWISAPGRFRVETEEPANQLLLSDGARFWNYDPDLEQVIISKLDASNVPILLLTEQREELERLFIIDTFEDEVSHYFVLQPKATESLFTSLNLEVNDGVPAGLSIIDSMGQRTHIEFESFETMGVPGKDLFTFTLPPGTDVIEEQ